MSVDNNHLKNREIQALREEMPRPDAKAELIMALSKQKRESKMSILRKATLPTLVSVAAIAGVFFVAQPRVVAATPDRVIKAIQDIKNYTINSFTIDGGARHLQSQTIVNGKDRKTVYYDTDGKVTTGHADANFIMINSSPMKMGFHVGPDGNLKDMSKEDIEKMRGTIHIIKDIKEHDGNGQDVKVQITKGPDGKEVKHIFVNGKEVDKMPEGANTHFQIRSDQGSTANNIVKVEVKKGPDGKEEKHIFVNGKEVDKLPEGMNAKLMHDGKTFKIEVTKDASGKEVKHFFVNGKEVDKLPEGMAVESDGNPKIIRSGQSSAGIVIVNAESMKSGKGSISKSMAAVVGDSNPMIVRSGQTSADYLVSLLKDTTRWTIERGVDFNGQRLDKFTLKGPISPIVLYVDPATALPRVLRFGTPMMEGATIEDVYEYNIQP